MFEPSLRLCAQLVAGGAEIILRQSGAALIEQKRGYATSGVRRTAERNGVEMHALEVTRRLVFLGVADGTERCWVSSETRRNASPAKATAELAK